MDTADGEVVLIAAMEREFGGLRRHASAWVDLQWRIEFARRISVGGSRFIVAANGPGLRLASEGIREIARRTRIRHVVSTGFCGALAGGVPVGAVVVAGEVVDVDSGERFPAVSGPAASGSSGPFQNGGGHRPVVGVIASGDRVITTTREKAELHSRTGAIAVEMEAAAIARWAHHANAPFSCIRAVTDSAGDSFSLDLNGARDKEGRFRIGSLLAQAIRRPATGFPELFAMQRNSNAAAQQLGDFLACCRF